MRKARIIAITAVMAVWMSGALLTSVPVTFSPQRLDTSAPSQQDLDTPAPQDLNKAVALSEMIEGPFEDDGDEAAGMVDLFGNEVSNAVAKYKFDPTGSLYEVHSPRTELPRLGVPRS